MLPSFFGTGGGFQVLMDKVKWGVLGCSGFAARRSIPAMLMAPSVELVGVASRTKDKADAFCSQFGLSQPYASYEELIADPQISALHIPLPNSMHEEWMLAALESGKHILCEKPFTVNEAEAQAVAAAASSKKLHVQEGIVWRYHPQHHYAAEVIQSGRIGKVTLVRAAFTFTLVPGPNIRRDPSLGGGCLLDVGGYPVSASRFYLGGEPESLYALGEFDQEHQIDVSFACTMKFATGMSVFDCSFNLPYRTDMEIVGDKGRIYFPRAWQPDEQATVYVNDELVKLPAANQYALMFEDFSRCLIEGRAPSYGASDAVQQSKVLAAIRRSLVSKLPQVVA